MAAFVITRHVVALVAEPQRWQMSIETCKGRRELHNPSCIRDPGPRPRPSTCFSRPRRAPPFSASGEQAANVLGRNVRLDMAQRVKTMQPRGEHRVACVLSRLGSISEFVSGLQRRRVLQRPRDACMRMASSFRRNASRRSSKGRGTDVTSAWCPPRRGQRRVGCHGA